MNAKMQEPRVIANVADSRGGDSKGRGRGQNANSRAKGGSGKGKSNKVCTCCEKIGHTVDKCQQKYGYPPNYFKKNEGKINNCTQDNGQFKDDKESESIVLEDNSKDVSSGSFTFTAEQRDALLAILQNQGSSHVTNQVSTSRQNNKGIVCVISQYDSLRSQIVDTGATYHVCQSRNKFQCLRKIKPVVVKLPVGSHMIAHMARTIVFSTQLYLQMCFIFPHLPLI